MSTDGTARARGGDAARVLTIDLEELTWALNSRHPLGECSHWLNLDSGAILSLIGPDGDDEADEDPRDDDRWLFIEPIESSEAFGVMEDFVDQCGDDRLARALGQALRQRTSPSVVSRTCWPRIRPNARPGSPSSARPWR
ncbi:MAG TPA: UPF0158 family protein [Rubrivivax sp.]|nr:UPF0158 family protein [Rubrivivax sp.]